MNEDLKELFRDGAMEYMLELEEALLRLGESPDNKEEIDRVFRVMHTIKGSSGMIGFDDVSVFAHHLETEFDLIRVGEATINPEIITTALLARDHIAEMIDAHFGGPAVDCAQADRILALIHQNQKPDEKNPRFQIADKGRLVIDRLENTLKELVNEPSNRELSKHSLVFLKEIRLLSTCMAAESVSEFLSSWDDFFTRVGNGAVQLTREIVDLALEACSEAKRMITDSLVDPNTVNLDPEKVLASLQRPMEIQDTLKQLAAKLDNSEPAKPSVSTPTKSFRIRLSFPSKYLNLKDVKKKIAEILRIFGSCTMVKVDNFQPQQTQEARES